MKVLGVIPARYASTRFPGKPLIQINGKSMIERVYMQAKKSDRLHDVIVATDDQRIADEVLSFGGLVQLTATDHQSGTDRCAEVARSLSSYDVIINIQGDEPYISPEQINLLISCFDLPETKLATLIKVIDSEEELFNVNIPKVTINTNGEAIYFSRQTIPFIRGKAQSEWLVQNKFFKHIGIYGYHAQTLQLITQLMPSMLEYAESLEQL
ncbi:MAG: 3-deoxy-manno-octulosonate cytidylyltransferase, partial [Pedobacter sp.]